MQYILISLLVFFVSVLVHIVVFNIKPASKFDKPITILIYILGFFINFFLLEFFYHVGSSWLSLPISAILLYGLLSICFVMFFLSPFLGEESPTPKILLFLKQGKKLSYDQIVSRFRDETLIDRRLDSMAIFNWIRKSKSSYHILPRGQKIARIIEIYRKILGWETFG